MAYTITMMQDAAREWWMQWLRSRGGQEPTNLQELERAMIYRFGNQPKEQSARAELRNICQLRTESVRAYSSRFSMLLGHLPQYDDAWAKDLFTSGLTTRVAELLMLKNPPTLQDQMVEAERIEITFKTAQNTRAGGSQSATATTTSQGNTGFRGTPGGWRARGRGRRGGRNRGGQNGQNGGRAHPARRGDQRTGFICFKCGGEGHAAAVCPSVTSDRGGRGGRHFQRGRRSRGRGQGRMINAGMATEDHVEDQGNPSTSSQNQEN